MPGGIYTAGNPAPREMGIRSVWRRTGGSEYERRWWGKADSVRAMEPYVRASGAVEVTIDQAQNSPIAILTARMTGASPGTGQQTLASETVDISFSDQTFPMHMNPTFIGITTEKIQEIERKISDKAANTYTAGTAEYRYYDLRQRGTESYHVQTPVLVWTRTASVGYPAISDLENVGKIFTTADLAYSVGAPLLFTVPTGNVGIVTGSVFTAGWMKTGQVNAVSNGQTQIVLRGEYGLWANDLYTFV